MKRYEVEYRVTCYQKRILSAENEDAAEDEIWDIAQFDHDGFEDVEIESIELIEGDEDGE